MLATQANPPAQLQPGVRLNERYEIQTFLGSGGMAAVYRAQDLVIERPVALKIMTHIQGIHDKDLYHKALDRFQREAKLAAQIRHPNAVNIFDMGITELQQPYIVMDLVDGWELDDELKQNGPMAPARALPMFCRCLEALSEGHKLGIVHKDLKPSNMMLHKPGTPQEDLLILDFGVAALERHDAERLTQAGAVLGTPQYLPPEYSRHRTVTTSLDVYQMALSLVEALIGKAVVRELHPMSAMLIHIQRQVELPNTILDSPLGPILRKALAYKHTDRYQNATEFRDALLQLDFATIILDPNNRATTPIHSTAPEPPTLQTRHQPSDAASQRAGRLPSWPVLLIALIALLGVGLIMLAMIRDKLSDPQPAPLTHIPSPKPPTTPSPPHKTASVTPPATPPAPPDVKPTVTKEEPVTPIQVRLVTKPSQAQIYQGKAKLTGPIVFTDPQQDPITIHVKAKGHKSRQITIRPTDAPELVIKLAPRKKQGHDTKRSLIAD